MAASPDSIKKETSPKSLRPSEQFWEKRRISEIIDVDAYIERRVVYKEIIREVPIEIRKEVMVPVEVIKKVEVVKEVIREVPTEVPVEKVVEQVKIIEVPIETIVYKEKTVEAPKVTFDENTRIERSPNLSDKVLGDSSPARYTGLGMRLSRRDDSPSVWVEEIIQGFAASECGSIAVGDLVERINGNDLSGWSLDQIKQVTVGPIGSICKARIRRGPRVFDVVLTRTVPPAAVGGGGSSGRADMPSKYQEKVDIYVSRSPIKRSEVGEA